MGIRALFILLAAYATCSGYVYAGTVSPERMTTLAFRVTGLKPRPAQIAKWQADPRLANNEEAFVEELFNDPNYANIRLTAMISRLSNEEAEPYQDVDDYQAALLVAFKNNTNVFKLFTGGFKLQNPRGDTDPARISYSIGGDFNSFDELAKGLKTIPLADAEATAPEFGQYKDGLFTTQGFAKRFLSNGTNRREIRAVYDTLLCTKIDRWKDASLSPAYIGQDVDRFAGGDHLTFKTTCAACHAPMDSQRGAFAYYDYDDQMNRVKVLTAVPDKYLRNSSINDGIEIPYRTSDDSWENLLVEETHRDYFRWRNPVSGNGVRSFAAMIVGSTRFDRCMTMKMYQEFCQLPEDKVAGFIENRDFRILAGLVRASGYEMRSQISRVVRSKLCDR